MTMLERDPAHRPLSMAHVRDALRSLWEGDSPLPNPPEVSTADVTTTPSTHTPGTLRPTFPWGTAGGILAAVLVAGGSGYWLWHASPKITTKTGAQKAVPDDTNLALDARHDQETGAPSQPPPAIAALHKSPVENTAPTSSDNPKKSSGRKSKSGSKDRGLSEGRALARQQRGMRSRPHNPWIRPLPLPQPAKWLCRWPLRRPVYQ